MHEFFKLSGPVICNQIQINDGIETGTYPTFSAFPPLGSLVDGQVYLNPDNTSDVLDDAGPADGLGEAQQPPCRSRSPQSRSFPGSRSEAS